MPVIQLECTIEAPVERVFDLARSIDLHTLSASQTEERAIAGRTSGLITLGETVTWHARHFGVGQTLTSKITAMQRPDYFVDEMIQGVFRYMRHEHRFADAGHGKTVMTDHFDYRTPLLLMGPMADALFLKDYMTRFLMQRNETIGAFAESDRWKEVPGLNPDQV